MKTEITYDNKITRQFLIATVVWAVVSMLVGVLIAFQLNFWQMNGKFLEAITFGAFKADGVSFLSFGRLRPLHTNAAIFAFVGNMMFAGVYYSTQRLCKVRMGSDLLSKIHFWGWQLIIVGAAITIPAGLTRGKEYAELIWPINIAVAVVWLVFAANFFLTLKKRNEPSLYVALWFYIATILTVTMLYVVNHLQIPTSLTHSYPIFGGVQDALVQWWYGHNAVAFFLTTPILGIMYYYLPKAVNRPVYSYRLSIVHFWSLVFVYIWAGPHHLLHTALPKWLQVLGMGFSLMLWAPSWGGMLNGLLTLRGAWDKLRTDPVVKFFVVGVTFYGMSTFEGPLLSIRAVNSLSHYSDWTIGHVHSGTLGWNGFMAAGMIYWLLPRLWKRQLYSTALANVHFWIGLVGILLYVASMWVSGITQGLNLNATVNEGLLLKYPNFVDTLNAIRPLMLFRAIGGVFYLGGFLLLAYNVFRTVWKAALLEDTAEVVVWEGHVKEGKSDRLSWVDTFFREPFAYIFWIVFFSCLWFFLPNYSNIAAFVCCLILTVLAVISFNRDREKWMNWHDRLQKNWLPFSVMALIAAAIGGIVQIVPILTVQTKTRNIEERLQTLYTPLELEGRDIYIAEGCYNCHSQMIRTLVPDVMRYGPGPGEGYSRLGESIYDHPFQWGSKRTGPDLAREGGDRDNYWHYMHMMNPRSLSVGSNMPSYWWLAEQKFDLKRLPKKIAVQRTIGVPYPAMNRNEIEQKALEQGREISQSLADKVEVGEDTKMVALIAYLQKLGTYETVEAKESDGTENPPILKPGIPDNYRPTDPPKTSMNTGLKR